MDRKPEADLQSGVARLRAEHARRVARFAAVRAAWLALALLLALPVLDGLLALPAAVRVLLDATLVGLPAAAAIAARRRGLASPSPERMVARLAEQADPALGNRLVNALDLRDLARAREPEGLSRPLMERAIEDGAARAQAIADCAFLSPARLARERRLLAAAAALLLAAPLVSPRLFLATLPRFLLPGGDFPPYSLTEFDVEPGDAQVDYGADLNVAVHTRGRKPPAMSLVLEDTRRRRLAELPLYESESNTYFQTLEHISDDCLYHAAAGSARSKRYRVGVVKVPRIDAVRVTYEYPAYTRLRSETRYLPDGVVRGYRGTRATLLITSNRRLAGGEIRIGTRAIAMAPASEPNTVAGTFAIEGAGPFTAGLRDEEGRAANRTLEGRIELLPDQKPEVAVVSPGQDSFATPGARIPVNIEARDDLGIAEIRVYRGLNGSPDFARALYAGAGAHAFVNVMDAFDLGDLGVRPGDTIDYYVTATDSRPDEPQTAASPAFRLVVISEEEYAQFVRSRLTAEQLEAAYGRLLDGLQELAAEQQRLRDEAERLRSENAPADEARRRSRLRDLEEQQARLAQRARESAEEFAREAARPAVVDVEHDYKAILKSMAERLGQAASDMAAGEAAAGRAAEAAGAEAQAGALAEAVAAQERALANLGASEREYRERIAQAGRDITRLFALYEDVETFKALLERQKAIERQARSLAEEKEPDFQQRVRLRELQADQEDVRRQIGELGASLARHAEAARDDYPKMATDAEAIAAKISELGIEKTMGGAAGSFRVLDGSQGHAQALRAYEDMLSMVSLCQSGGGQAQAECENRLRITMNVALGQTFSQLAQNMNFGMGLGAGGMGTGQAGQGSGGQTPFGLYGPSDFLDQGRPEMAGIGRRNEKAQSPLVPPGSEAGSLEEIAIARESELEIDAPGGDRMIEEYKPLIVEYFRRMGGKAEPGGRPEEGK